MVLMIDNYDSFTFNIVQYLAELGHEVRVFRNDEITVEQAAALAPQAIVVSPGPSAPEHAGISIELIRSLAGRIPILGVCLGHQAIVEAFGGEVGQARELLHGKASPVRHDGAGVFAGLPDPFDAGRYHSLAATHVPETLTVTATSEDGEVMGVRHRELRVEGVQFHPESVLTPLGPEVGRNFLCS
jgi:anthranilate synthase component 2